VNSREECLSEAAECDRLASLANTLATRNIMRVAAFHWRKLAEKAAERQRPLSARPGSPTMPAASGTCLPTSVGATLVPPRLIY
jgi:hypothetical protein